MKHGKAFGAAAMLVGAVCGGALVKEVWLKKYREQKRKLELISKEREQLHRFLELGIAGVKISEYFSEKAIGSVAVLGMNREGRCLLKQLELERAVTPVYGVEARNYGAVHEHLTVYRLSQDELPPADCLVVCDLEQTEEERTAAQKEFPGKIVVLDEVLDWLYQKHSLKKWKGGPRDI